MGWTIPSRDAMFRVHLTVGEPLLVREDVSWRDLLAACQDKGAWLKLPSGDLLNPIHVVRVEQL